MNDQTKTKKQLIEELAALRKRTGAYNKEHSFSSSVIINACEGIYGSNNIPDYLYVNDITEWKAGEIANRESEDKYRTLIETTDTGFVILDNNGTVIDANAEYVRLTGHKRLEDIIGRSVTEWTTESERKKNALEIMKCFETGFVRNLEINYTDKDGKLTPIEINATVLATNKGSLILTLCRDISKRKQADEELVESEERYRQIVELSPDVIYIQCEGNIVFINTAGVKLFGATSPALLIGRRVVDLIHPHYRKIVKERIRQLKEKRTEVPLIEEVYLRLDGTSVDVEVAATPITYHGKLGAEVIVRDITERKKAEAALKQAEEELFRHRKHLEEMVKERTQDLERTNKELHHEITERKRYEAQLSALSAHLQSIREEERKHIAREIHDELGQVLTVLKMDFRSLCDELSTEQTKVDLNTEHINQLIDRAIDSVQQVCLELRPAIVDELGLSAAIEWLAQEVEKRANIKHIITFEPKEIIVDREYSIALFRICQELLNNVVRHARATMVTISLKRKKNSLMIRIKDDGIGITDEQCFHPEALGMIGIRERVQFLGGSLAIRGIKDKGTTATISIPYKRK
jgi:PAS domain S-box-containing protein